MKKKSHVHTLYHARKSVSYEKQECTEQKRIYLHWLNLHISNKHIYSWLSLCFKVFNLLWSWHHARVKSLYVSEMKVRCLLFFRWHAKSCIFVFSARCLFSLSVINNIETTFSCTFTVCLLYAIVFTWTPLFIVYILELYGLHGTITSVRSSLVCLRDLNEVGTRSKSSWDSIQIVEFSHISWTLSSITYGISHPHWIAFLPPATCALFPPCRSHKSILRVYPNSIDLLLDFAHNRLLFINQSLSKIA